MDATEDVKRIKLRDGTEYELHELNLNDFSDLEKEGVNLHTLLETLSPKGRPEGWTPKLPMDQAGVIAWLVCRKTGLTPDQIANGDVAFPIKRFLAHWDLKDYFDNLGEILPRLLGPLVSAPDQEQTDSSPEPSESSVSPDVKQ
jgi:hypothetical protein